MKESAQSQLTNQYPKHEKLPMPTKVLGTFAIVMINIIVVDSLRSLPFSAVYGFSLIFYYLIATLSFFIPSAMFAAELATGWPNKGGVYVWVREAFGERWGFLTIWLQWIYNIVWYPTILSFIAGALAFLINPNLANDKIYMLTIVLVIFWSSTFINFFGMQVSSAVSTFAALVGTLIPMFFIIGLGIYWLYKGNPIQITLSWKTLLPEFNDKADLVFLTAVLFGLVGMEMSAVHADEVRNPGKVYPRAMWLSGIIIVTSLVCSSLAIAIVVPQQELNVVTGLVQAFSIFFHHYHMSWMIPLITIFIIIGGIGAVATWIIGPTKGLLVAVADGSAPAIFGRVNRYGVPVIILLMQGIIFTLLCSVFLLLPTVASSYWILTAMTAQLAMLVYIALFAAGIYLRYKAPDTHRDYRIPGGKLGIWVIGLLGLSSCIFAILLGFIPPSQIQVGNIWIYESILLIGIIILCLPPLIIFALFKRRKIHYNPLNNHSV